MWNCPEYFRNLHESAFIMFFHQFGGSWFIANVFSKLQTVKIFVRPLCKKGRFETRLDSTHVKVSRILEYSPWECMYHFFSSIWEKLIPKISPQGLDEIYGVFVNTLSANGKYPVPYYGKLPLPNKMQLSEKLKNISQFSVAILDSTSSFKHLEEKDDGHS